MLLFWTVFVVKCGYGLGGGPGETHNSSGPCMPPQEELESGAGTDPRPAEDHRRDEHKFISKNSPAVVGAKGLMLSSGV